MCTALKPPIFYILIFCLFSSVPGWAQQSDSLSNIRSKMISTHTEEIRLDSNSIVPQSVILSLPPEYYHIDYVNAILYWDAKPEQDSLAITYRIFPFKFNRMMRRYNYDSIRFNFSAEKPFVIGGQKDQEKIIDFGDINYNGSLGRGISFGNNQDAVVNSTLNLQLNGFIGDSLELTAAISDNNLPIQPEGNTQNLREFDKIFMQIKKGGWQANFGDIDVRQNPGYFLKFYKRLQGASFETVNKISKNTTNSLIASGAIAKGKFVRNNITPIEGNQGPYKLHGANNELYFAVLAGTERIYLNGELLTRGEDQDYVIDYNIAEITFTVKRLITKDSRIQAEFEYSDRSFLNSMLYVSDQINIKDKWKISVGAYSNSDAKNSPINQTLTGQQKTFLSTIGNRIDSALYPNASIDTFSSGKILYKRMDTVYNGITDSIYEYSIDPADTLYNLSFTNVGPGKGNYVAAVGNANGRVFKWIAPFNGEKQGEWEPVILLITPKKHQIFSTGIEYRFTPKTFLKTEVAFSNYDVNTFSSLGNKENNGIATKIDFGHEQKIFKKSKLDFKLKTAADYEYTAARFKSIETLRNIEFNRDWSLPYISEPASEHILKASVKLEDKRNDFLRYQFTSYTRGDGYQGVRNTFENAMTINGWHVNSQIFLTQMKSNLLRGRFIRPSVEVYKSFKALNNITLGGKFTAENNRQSNRQYDTLTPISFGFHTWEFYIKSDQGKKDHWGISYHTRENKLPLGDKLVSTDHSRNIALSTELLKSDKRRFKMQLTYRELSVNKLLPSALTNEKSLLGRSEYEFNEWKGLLSGNILYEIGSGREQKREYTYLEVPAGQGYYTWNDYNGDGVPQVNEFEVAVFQDQKTWIKIFTPTQDYVKANYTRFNYNLTLSPDRILKKPSNHFEKFLSRISLNSALQVQKKEIARGDFAFNPFGKNLNDTTLISLNTFMSNALHFNRISPTWGFDLTQRLNNTKAILNYGFESNSSRIWNLRGRWNLSRSVNISMDNNWKKLELNNPSFTNRNYTVKDISLKPSVSYIYKTDFRISLLYTYGNKKNFTGLKETATQNVLSAEFKYNIFASGALNGKFSMNNIIYRGNPNSPVGFLMLEGLVPGKNYLWNIELTKRLAGNIEVNLRYEGRQPGNHKAIHTGQASIRAIF